MNITNVMNFKKWLKNNGLDDNYSCKWWNIDTSLTSMFKKFKSYNLSELEVIKITGKEINEKGCTIIVKGFNEQLSWSAWSQYLRVLLLFGCIEKPNDFVFNTAIDFGKQWVNNNIVFKFSDKFKNSNNFIEYFCGNMDYLWNCITSFAKSKENIFMIRACYDLLFTLYLFYSLNKETDKKEKANILLIVEEFKKKKTTETKSFEGAANSNRELMPFLNVLFGDKNDEKVTIDEGTIEKTINETIGFLGEYLFSIFLKNFNKLKKFTDISKVRSLKFEEFKWESQIKKTSPYDFRVDNYNLFEVKSSMSKDDKEKFIISDNEFECMKEYKDYYFLCTIKNIDPNVVDLTHSKPNFELFKDLKINFYNFQDFQEKFDMKSRGYWVREL
ncbi:hypothetical protein SCHIN_v1c08160 [Spiroplasma chinense]|uniref:Protein NO VEIN C-terminal domain-containing protein n=1 Tax=Spiroplasma chinense TaxID=216932 RepID=A0A5B9Y4N8_9MOLU|nr:DUF3883 domain-containing protein [Spiroplasma chinense]QEH62011.1 hypothetical protein SCHIN_v1c08160 [Spiroplasma chinense]